MLLASSGIEPYRLTDNFEERSALGTFDGRSYDWDRDNVQAVFRKDGGGDVTLIFHRNGHRRDKGKEPTHRDRYKMVNDNEDDRTH